MFGISTHCLSTCPLPEVLEALHPLTSYVEVMDDGLHYLQDSELLESFTFRYSIHAPSRGVNIASQLEPIRRASVEVIVQSFSVAAGVNARVVVHPGYYAWPADRKKAEMQLQVSLNELSKEAEDRGIIYYIENMPSWEYFFLTTPKDLPLLGGVPLCLDVGHAHMNGCLEEFLSLPFGHVHLHDNNGHSDSHSTVGEGTINFSEVMKAVMREGATPIIEVGTLEGAKKSLEILSQMI